MIEEIGTVSKTSESHIWVRSEIKSTCSSCHAQSNCGTGVIAKTFAPKSEELCFEYNQQVKVGQQVKLGIPESQFLTASAIVYLIPLLTLVGSAIVAHVIGQWIGGVSEFWTIFTCFIATFFAFKWVSISTNKNGRCQYQPQLLQVLPAQIEDIPVKHIV